MGRVIRLTYSAGWQSDVLFSSMCIVLCYLSVGGEQWVQLVEHANIRVITNKRAQFLLSVGYFGRCMGIAWGVLLEEEPTILNLGFCILCEHIGKAYGLQEKAFFLFMLWFWVYIALACFTSKAIGVSVNCWARVCGLEVEAKLDSLFPSSFFLLQDTGRKPCCHYLFTPE